MEKRGCRSVIAYSAWCSFRSTEVNLTMRPSHRDRRTQPSEGRLAKNAVAQAGCSQLIIHGVAISEAFFAA